jgi:hypothetical protein
VYFEGFRGIVDPCGWFKKEAWMEFEKEIIADHGLNSGSEEQKRQFREVNK